MLVEDAVNDVDALDGAVMVTADDVALCDEVKLLL